MGMEPVPTCLATIKLSVRSIDLMTMPEPSELVTVRYGKSNAEYIKGKGHYFDRAANSYWVSQAVAVSAKYAEQPRRDKCVICESRLGKPAFRYLGADYALCGNCEHLNGLNEDTVEFSKFLYEHDQGGAAIVYEDETADASMHRVRSIYLPKANFLIDTLRSAGADPSSLRYVDFGAGLGTSSWRCENAACLRR